MSASTAAPDPAAQPHPRPATRPNVVVVLADDMGWGDLGCYGATQIATPHIDALAAEGMRFTDAHAASAVCTPSRYALLTGRLPFRSPLKQGVLMGHGPALVEPGRPTLGSVFRAAGYTTAAIGKWHLGLGWRHDDDRVWDANDPNDPLEYQVGDPTALHDRHDDDSGADVDYTVAFSGGPTELGFDRFFGIAGSLNMPPYAFLDQDRPTELPEDWKTDFLPGQRPGKQASDWDECTVDLRFSAEAVSFIEGVPADQPFLLYLATSAPHRPQVSPPFLTGSTGAGSRGDSVAFFDWIVGQVVDALERTGRLDNTVVVVTSDNGSPIIFPDELDERHMPNGPWRGQKGDVWEGGHREPLVVRWPGTIPAGVVSEAPVDLVDLLPTLTGLVGAELPAQAAEDGQDQSALLRAGATEADPTRLRVRTSMGGAVVAERDGWKVAFASGSGGGLSGAVRTDTTGGPTGATKGSLGSKPEPGQLFHLPTDPAEERNRWAESQDVVEAFRRDLVPVLATDLDPARVLPGWRRAVTQ